MVACDHGCIGTKNRQVLFASIGHKPGVDVPRFFTCQAFDVSNRIFAGVQFLGDTGRTHLESVTGLGKQFAAAGRSGGQNEHIRIMAVGATAWLARITLLNRPHGRFCGKDKDRMHFNFGFNAVQILWALTFAALLVLLVVLLGRDRAKRYPIFSFGIALVVFRLLTSRLLFGRLSPMAGNVFFLSLALIAGLVSLAIVVELARRAFADASRKAWTVGVLALLAVGGIVVALWGPWPAWKTLMGAGVFSGLRLVQLVAQRCDMLADVLAIELGILAAFAGRRFHCGWRSHTQQLIVGFSAAALSELAVRGLWQAVALHAVPQSMAEYERLLGLQEKFYNANSAVYLVVLVWWIICLWRNEPGTALPESEAVTESTQTAIEPPVDSEAH
jgi:hypothetical protein